MFYQTSIAFCPKKGRTHYKRMNASVDFLIEKMIRGKENFTASNFGKLVYGVVFQDLEKSCEKMRQGNYADARLFATKARVFLGKTKLLQSPLWADIFDSICKLSSLKYDDNGKKTRPVKNRYPNFKQALLITLK